MTHDKQNEGSIEAVVGDQPGSFKGGLGTTAITTTPVNRGVAPAEHTEGLGSSQITSTPVPKTPPASPLPTSQP